VKAPPLSLYVHLPWCVRKCPYCDFNSHAAKGGAPTDRYVDALLADLDQEALRAGGREIETVFLGGGTPSLFAPPEISRLIEGIDVRLRLAPGAEITMEANPGTVECGSPAGYRAAGINRVSIGAQSFDDTLLQRLGRVHSSEDIRSSVDGFVAAGFDTLNLDLMHGLPGQTTAMAVADVLAATELGAPHISWYQLTLEPNTVFHSRPPVGLPDEEAAWSIQEAGAAALAEAGFEQYEVSAWARPGHRCRHNLNYWQFGDYLAVGAGAHGKITTDDRVVRFRKPANPAEYMQTMESGGAPIPAEVPTDAELVFEFMLNALRLVGGFRETVFEARTGLAAGVLRESAAHAVEKGLIQRSPEGLWRPTSLGVRFLNDLQAEFLPAA
jgi:oxygen-independent coproporphyrinogen-3 oxidase